MHLPGVGDVPVHPEEVPQPGREAATYHGLGNGMAALTHAFGHAGDGQIGIGKREEQQMNEIA